MASLSGEKPGTGIKYWNYYVADNPNWNKITYQVENNIKDEPILSMASNAGKVIGSVSSGDKLKIGSVQLIKIGNSSYAYVITDKKNTKNQYIQGFIRITAIRKPTTYINTEIVTLNLTNQKIKELKISSGNPYSPISVYVQDLGVVFDVDKLDRITKVGEEDTYKRTPKCDFVLKDKNNKSLVFISHKTGTNASDFHQYGGITDLYNNDSIKNYLKKLEILYKDSSEKDKKIKNNPFKNGVLQESVFSENVDNDVILKSIFGINYNSGPYGLNNVHLVSQGPFNFKWNNEKDYYELYFTKSFKNGDLSKLTGDYKPVIISTFKSGRVTKIGNISIRNVRTGIYPKSYRGSAKPIDSYFP
jgi:hypothetical protein